MNFMAEFYGIFSQTYAGLITNVWWPTQFFTKRYVKIWSVEQIGWWIFTIDRRDDGKRSYFIELLYHCR